MSHSLEHLSERVYEAETLVEVGGKYAHYKHLELVCTVVALAVSEAAETLPLYTAPTMASGM